MTAHAAMAEPTPEQRRAADPGCSVWVTASAGTGKTRVLADRVLRLLLAGTHPQRLLCLSFTKAAAAEMVTRIQGDLGEFTICPPDALDERLFGLLGRAPTAKERERARALFAQVLDLPAGLPIMTIHAFCQSLLRRFPLEAGIVPHFELTEERDAKALLHEAREEVLASDAPAIRAALSRLAVLLTDDSLIDALDELGRSRLKLHALVAQAGDIEAVIAEVYRVLGLQPGTQEEAIEHAACTDPAIDHPALAAACRILARGNDNDQERAAQIGAWLEADPAARRAVLDAYERIFLTKARKPRQPGRLVGKSAPDHEGTAAIALLAEQDRLLGWLERHKAAAIAARTEMFLHVGWAMFSAYERKKTARAALDFDDLIDRTRRLLAAPGIAAWVQYKLDQRIEHLLVDEGQDTNPDQWGVITALCDEFFSGEGAHEAPRTLFVVGDEKQSIFSFQGADIAVFQALRRQLGAAAKSAHHAWHEEELSQSFRSSPPILAVVDKVFEAAEARAGVVSDPAPLRHETARTAEAGIVEVWPLLEAEDEPKAEPWQLPDQLSWPERREHLLAQAIAERIKQWLTTGEPLPSTGRRITPGDVMILLPRRGILQDQLLRQLKRLGVPVGGADRLALIDELPVMDLMALGDAVLLPEDDLTLAALLKCPLFGLGEEDLFELAHDRGGASLHRRLRALAERGGPFAEASRRFESLRAQADFAAPFEFYARLLGEGGGRRRFLERLGPQAIEAIEAFLAQALAYERSHPPSLQGFLHWLRADSSDLARNPDQPRDEVRVLTVHGAKGLQSPIVFLADTTTNPTLKDCLLWRKADGLPLWRGSKPTRDAVTEAAWQQARTRQLEEHRRLLYVAMTRACDWLIVTGWQKKRDDPDTTWYELIDAGMARLGAERCRMEVLPGKGGMGWRFSNRPAAAARQLDLALGERKDAPRPPAWLLTPAPADGPAGEPLHPSRLDTESEAPAASPLSSAAEHRYRRGRLIHRLLQSLPGRAKAERDAAMARFLARPGLGLDPEQRREIAAVVTAVLDHPEFGALFAPGSRAEVPVIGTLGDRTIAGQVDRLAVCDDAVLVVDYKTNRAPPSSPADVPAVYWRQMAAYRTLLATIYPGRAVRCALLWTEGPMLMPLDGAELARYAPAPEGA